MEALRGGLHEHKENVEANISRGKLTYSSELPGKSRTPGDKLLPYSTPKSVKVSGKAKSSSTSKKPRRALGDISNQHRTPTDKKKTGAGLGGKRTGEGKLKANLNPTTPLSTSKSASAASLAATPKRAARVHDDAPEIELAYGGLPTYGPDPKYLERIRQEIQNELYNDTTPTIMDEYEIRSEATNRWSPEIRMLSGDATPSPWWATESPEDSSFAETTSWSDDSIATTVDLTTPEPDVGDDLLADNDCGLLNELLNMDIPVSVGQDEEV